MNKLDVLFSGTSTPVDFARGYANYLAELLGRLDVHAVASFIDTLLRARETGARVFFIGNGGSAATASHFANDIAIGTRTTDRPFRAISLVDNNAVVTAIANDDGYDQIFVQQLEVLMTEGDVVVSISASGNSPNVVKAVEYARSRGNATVALTGFDGGNLARICDTVIHVATARGEYGPVEDLHMVIDHLVGAYLFRVVRRDEQSSGHVASGD